MALPSLTLIGTATDASGNTLRGTLFFQPNAQLSYTGATPTVIPQAPIPVTLGNDGSFSVDILPCDAVNVTPTGWSYIVSQMTGYPNGRQTAIPAYQIQPTGTGTVNLADLTTNPVQEPSSVMYVPLEGGTMTGPLILSQDPTAPLGAATRRFVLDTASSAVTSVNEIDPVDGNVTLTAANVGALGAIGNQNLVGQYLAIGPTADSTFTPSDSHGAYGVLDKNNTASDASWVAQDQGAVRLEHGLVGGNNYHVKLVTGNAGSEQYHDAFIIFSSSLNAQFIGNVGIGTVPVDPLHVAGHSTTSRITAKLENTNVSGGGTAVGVQFNLAGNGVNFAFGTDVGLNGGDNLFFVNANAAYMTGFLVNAAGQLGILIDSPESALDVNGAATVRGDNSLATIRYRGRETIAGAPTSGTWVANDLVMDSNQVLWLCTSSGTPGTWISGAATKGSLVYNVKDYGALGNYATSATGAVTVNTAILTDANAHFTATQVGQLITVVGAGTAGIDLSTTILSVQSATQVTLNANATTGVTGATYAFGTNDSTAIQAAITAATAAGGTVYFPPGGYCLGSAIVPVSNVSFVGAGIGNSNLYPFATVPAVLLQASLGAPITNFTMAHLTIDGARQVNPFNVAYKGVFIQYLSKCTFDDLVIQNCIATGLGIDFLTNGTMIHNVRTINNGRGLGTAGCAGIGIGTGQYTVEDFVIDGCFASGNHTYGIFTETQTGTNSRGARISNCYSVSNGYAGFSDAGCIGLQYSNCVSASNSLDGFTIDNGTVATNTPGGQTMYTNCEAIANTRYGFSYAPTKSGQTSAGAGNYQYIGCKAWNNTSVGFAVFSSSVLVPVGWTLNGCEASGNGGSGVHVVTAVNGVSISACVFRANGQSSSTSKNGITIAAAVTRLWIMNNVLYDDGGTQKQAYGIQISTGITVTLAAVTGNDLRGNLTGPFNMLGTWATSYLDNNIGYAGTATRSAGPSSSLSVPGDLAATWTTNNPTLNLGEIGYETDTGLAKIGDGATAWTSLTYTWQPYLIDPYASIALFLQMLGTNGDPANVQSTPGVPSGIALYCKVFQAATGPITNILLDNIVPDTTAALTGLYVGVYDSNAGTPTGTAPGTLLGVSADFSPTVKALPGSGGKLSVPLVTPTSSIARNHKLYYTILCSAQSVSPVMTFVGGRNYGTNQAMTGDYRLWRSTASNLSTLASTAPSGANIEVSGSSYIWMGTD